VLSCIATVLLFVPLFLFKPSYYASLGSEKTMLIGFTACAFAIAFDLGCTNVALDELSVALQQTIKATSPAATLLLESIVEKKSQHWLVWLCIILLCFGPVLTKAGSTDYDGTTYGVVMMVLAVVSGAFKYVWAHQMIKTYRQQLGIFAFTFWVEVIVGIMLTPWALLNGEAKLMLCTMTGDCEGIPAASMYDTLLLWFTGAYGGVRIFSQFALLKYVPATTLAMSNVTIQAFTIILGVFLWETPLTPYLISGIALTLFASGAYVLVKSNPALTAKPEAEPKTPTKGALL